MHGTEVGVDIEVMDADDSEPARSLQSRLQQALDEVRSAPIVHVLRDQLFQICSYGPGYKKIIAKLAFLRKDGNLPFSW